MAKRKTKTVKFSENGIESLPKDKPIVYKIMSQNGENIYTGIAKRGRVEDRLKDHLPGGSDMIPGGVKVQIQQMPSISDAERTEVNIIYRSKPKYNKRGK